MDPDAEPEAEPTTEGRQLVGAPTPDAADFAAELDKIRAAVHRWISVIEQHLPESADDSISEREKKLALDVQRLERDRLAFQAEIEHRDEDWDLRLEALEQDRLLLAEAWERLECEQLAAVGSSRAATYAAAAVDHAPPPRSEPSRSDSDTAVSRAILRQFESLRQDVRTQAGARRSG